METQTFEDYLQEQFILSEPQILDDDIPDAFNDWLVDLAIDEIIDYAEKWHLIIK